MVEILGGAILVLLTYVLSSRKKNAEAVSAEMKVMEKALQVLTKFTEELTTKVEELTLEVNTLKNINRKLEMEVINLENILKSK
jgi:uncharacterized protein YoxC